MHTAVCIGDEIVLFGGNQGSATNDLHVLSMETGQWELKEPTGESPEERTYHAAVAWGRKMLVFGGFPSFPSFAKWGAFGGGDMAKNDLHEYDAEACSWARVEAGGDVPSGRHGMTAVVAEGAVYVFGGYSGNAAMNDLFRLDVPVGGGSLGGCAWTRLQPSGTPPPPRWRHVSWAYGGDVYVLGGSTREAQALNLGDLHCYRVAENRWEAVECAGEAPSARHDCTAVVHGEVVYLFGGNAGGRKAAEPLNDLWKLDLRKCEWERVPGTPPAGARYAHAALATPEGMLVVGGDTGSEGQKLGDAIMYAW